METTEPVWGAPQPAPQKPRWSGRKTVIAVAVAVGVAAAGGAAIYATSSSSTTTQAQAGGPGGMGQGRGGPGGGGLMDALHGTFTVSDGNGTYTEEAMQTGTVTAVDSSSITAKSTDGYTKTYKVTSSQLSGIATGDTVTVIAKGDTATSVREGRGGPPAN